MFLIFSLVVQNFDTPESIFFDGDFAYVSCINGSPSKKDGNGYIAKIKKTGEIVKKDFIKGLNAPKGIMKKDKYIFFTDIDRVCVYDIEGNLIDTISLTDPKGSFLNDIFVIDSVILVSDSKNNYVYKLLFKDRKLKLLKMYNVSGGPNGIYFYENKVYIATWQSGEIIQYDIEFNEKKVLFAGLSELDGLNVVNGIITVSSWDGNIYQIIDGKKTILVKNLVSPADFFLKDLIIFIPEFTENRIRIERLE